MNAPFTREQQASRIFSNAQLAAGRTWQWVAPHINDARFFQSEGEARRLVTVMGGWAEPMPLDEPKPAKKRATRKPKGPKVMPPLPWERNRRF